MSETNPAVFPMKGFVVVERIAAPDKSEGGILIPESAKEKAREGTVLSSAAVGNDLWPGDHVFFGAFAGTEIVVEKKEYLILAETEVLGMLPRKTNTRPFVDGEPRPAVEVKVPKAEKPVPAGYKVAR